jgi:hypothetical protein
VARWFVGRVVDRWDGDGDHLGLVLAPVAAAAGEGDGGAILRMGGVEDLRPGHPA